MKRVIIICCYAMLMTSCLISITSDHNETRQSMEGFMERLLDEYYSDVIRWFPESTSYQDKTVTFRQIDDNIWTCSISEKPQDTPVWEWNVSATATITVVGNSKTYSMVGTVTEEEYVTRFFTLGDGIKDYNGVLRAEVFDKQGNGIGWGEAIITESPSYGHEPTYVSGEF